MNNPRVSTSDFIGLDYTADLTEAGIAYMRQFTLAQPHDQANREVYEVLRQQVASHLSQNQVTRRSCSENAGVISNYP